LWMFGLLSPPARGKSKQSTAAERRRTPNCQPLALRPEQPRDLRLQLLLAQTAYQDDLVAAGGAAGEFHLGPLQPQLLANQVDDGRVRASLLGGSADGDLERLAVDPLDAGPLRTGLDADRQEAPFCMHA